MSFFDSGRASIGSRHFSVAEFKSLKFRRDFLRKERAPRNAHFDCCGHPASLPELTSYFQAPTEILGMYFFMIRPEEREAPVLSFSFWFRNRPGIFQYTAVFILILRNTRGRSLFWIAVPSVRLSVNYSDRSRFPSFRFAAPNPIEFILLWQHH